MRGTESPAPGPTNDNHASLRRRPSPYIWYAREDLNLQISRFVVECPSPLNDGRVNLAGRPGFEPGTSAFRARRAANCASGQWLGGSESNTRSQLQRLAAYH